MAVHRRGIVLGLSDFAKMMLRFLLKCLVQPPIAVTMFFNTAERVSTDTKWVKYSIM